MVRLVAGCRMRKDDIIRMAREAGFPIAWISDNDGGVIRWADIERFAALVAAAEREACAKVCDARAIECDGFTEEQHASEKLAEDIRARGQA